MTNGTQSNKKIFEIQQWIHNLLVAINLSIVSYAALLIHDLDVRTSVIEGNGWTAREGAQVFLEIAEINEKLAALPSEYPPQWLRDFVRENRERIVRLEEGRDR